MVRYFHVQYLQNNVGKNQQASQDSRKGVGMEEVAKVIQAVDVMRMISALQIVGL